ncbi:lipoprotein transporter activity [Sparganum proliferum]
MQRDLGRQALSESETNDELDYLRQRAKSLDVEVKALREQVSSTRRELVENERASHRQIAQLDKRLHENWLSARASENLVKELRDENTALRQKIGDGEKRTLQQLISRGPPVPMPLLHQPLVPPGGSKKPDSRPSSRQLGNSTAQMPLKQGSGSRHTPSFLPPPPSLPGMPPFTAGAPGVPFMPPPPPPPPPGLIPPKGGLPLLPSVQRTFSNRNSPILPGWEVMHAPASPPAAPHSNSGSSRSAKR